MQTIENMTIEQLKQLVEDTVDTRLTRLLGEFEILDESDDSKMTWADIRDAVKRHRWSPPENAKSSLELLREDRDR